MKIRRTDYRRLWESNFGPIPKDCEGRSYEIHHVDGDHDNRAIENLTLVTVQEHYDIHYAQGDWGACLIMSERMKISPEEKSELARLAALKRVEEGNHHFLGDRNPMRRAALNGTHHWQTQEYSEAQTTRMLESAEAGNHPWQKGHQTYWNIKRVEEGTHPWAGERGSERNRKLLEEGRHNSQVQWTCEHCGKSGMGIANYNQYHGANCLSVNPTRSTAKVRTKKLERTTCEHCGLETSTTNYKKYHGDNCLIINPNRNFKNSKYTRTKPPSTCPHCGKTCDGGNYNRYHGDKCKYKNVTAVTSTVNNNTNQ